MAMFKIPGVSFSLKRALGITQVKQKFARETGIPTSKAGLERKVGKMVLNAIFGKKRCWFHTSSPPFHTFIPQLSLLFRKNSLSLSP